MLFQTQGQITQIRTLEDRGLKLSVETISSLSSEEITKLFELRDKTGWFVFKENEIKQEDINLPDISSEKIGRSHAERLRAVIYLRGQREGIKPEDSEFYYKGQMEMLLSKYKEKLN